MRGCGLSNKSRGLRKKGEGLTWLQKLARKGGIDDKMCLICAAINIMDDKYAYYASQAVYGSGVHHDYLTNEGFIVDNDFTNHNTKTYVRNGQALVAYKGTNPLNIVDLDADATIAIGTHKRHDQFKKASELAKGVREKYGNITTTGHSLGGTKAIESANDAGGRAVVFNPGTGVFRLKTGDHKVYVKNQDPISLRVDGANVHKSDGGHSLDGYKSMFEPRIIGSAQKISSGARGGVSKKKRGWRF